MAPLQHTLSLEKISELNQKFEKTARDLQAEVKQKREFLRWRKIALVPFWIFVFVMVSALWLKYQKLKKGHKEGQSHG